MMDFMNYGAVKIPLNPPLEKGEFYISLLLEKGEFYNSLLLEKGEFYNSPLL